MAEVQGAAFAEQERRLALVIGVNEAPLRGCTSSLC
jgi:hypothetical protein